MADEAQPIIIKKVKKGGHRHHGGAWKVAYADFVTAMMAFFLLLWLLNAVTQDQLEGIANYFAPVSLSRDTSGAGGILGGKTVLEEGSRKNVTARASVNVDLPPPKAGDAGGEETVEETAEDTSGAQEDQEIKESEAEELLERKEEEQFEKAEEELRETIQDIPNLERLADSLLIDSTPEGLRIQIIDQEGLAMFPRSSAKMYAHTRKILELVAKVVVKMPQKLKISGHTDALRYVSQTDYSNWELSADRANASRRALLDSGVPFQRVARVVGMAATEPLVADNPTHPSNRRISIVLLRGTGAAKPATAGKKPAPAEKKPAQGEEKPAEAKELLPGLEEIRRRQILDGSPHPNPAEAEKKTAAEAEKKAAETEEKPIEAGELLPGLEEIRRKQLRGVWGPKKPAVAGTKPAETVTQPAETEKKPARAADEPAETGELLPGLEEIRRKQLLEESRSN